MSTPERPPQPTIDSLITELGGAISALSCAPPTVSSDPMVRHAIAHLEAALYQLVQLFVEGDVARLDMLAQKLKSALKVVDQ